MLVLLSRGLANKEIANRVRLNLHTVNTFLKRLKKQHVDSRAEAVVRYAHSNQEQRMLSPD